MNDRIMSLYDVDIYIAAIKHQEAKLRYNDDRYSNIISKLADLDYEYRMLYAKRVYLNNLIMSERNKVDSES
jgi:hypothetical protein